MRIASLTTRNFTCLSILTVQDQAMALEAMERCISDLRKRMYRTNLCGVTNVVNVFPATWKLFRWLTCVVVWGGGVTYKQVKIVINKWKRKKKEKKKRENSPKKKGTGEGSKILSLTWIIDDFESFKSTKNSVPINGYGDFNTRSVYETISHALMIYWNIHSKLLQVNNLFFYPWLLKYYWKKNCQILPESIHQCQGTVTTLHTFFLLNAVSTIATLILVTKGRRMFKFMDFRYLLRLWPFQCFVTIVVLQRWVGDVVSLRWQLLFPLLVEVM